MSGPSAVPPLDLFTVKVMTLITVLVVSFSTLLAWRVNRRVVGMGLFALGLLSISVGGVLGIGRLVVAGKPILIACNSLMLAGMISVAQGIRRFRGFRPVPLAAVGALIVGVSVFYFYWMFEDDTFGKRVGVMSLAYVLLSVDAAASLFRRVPSEYRLIYWPTGLAFVFTAAYLSVRTYGALSGYYGADLLAPVPLEVATTICADIAYLGCAFGMLLASNTQMRTDAERMALFDPLTNLPNRRLFLDRLLHAQQLAATIGNQFGVIYLDLDEFKLVNDTMGHSVGDSLLKQVAAVMTRTVSSADCVARIGGDEFVVLIERVSSRDDLIAIAARLKWAVENEPVSDDIGGQMRISCGVAMFPSDGGSAHDVMREADRAMYLSKRQGALAR